MTPMEKLMSQYPAVKFTFRDNFPTKLSGLTYGSEIFINKNKPAVTQYEVMFEEIAHYETGCGNIVNQRTRDERQQEQHARSLAFEHAVPLDGLIYCSTHDLWSVDEMVDYFNVSAEFLLKALDNYTIKKGPVFTYHGYLFDLLHNFTVSKIRK